MTRKKTNSLDAIEQAVPAFDDATDATLITTSEPAKPVRLVTDPIRLTRVDVAHVKVRRIGDAAPAPVQKEIVNEHHYRRDAIGYARAVIEAQGLPAGVPHWKVSNALRFANGKVPGDIATALGLGSACSFADVLDMLDRQIFNPRPKGTYGGFAAGELVRNPGSPWGR